MTDLLKFEFRKLKRQKSFYVILAIMVALVVLSAVMSKLLESLASEIDAVADAMDGESIAITGAGTVLGVVSASMFSTLAAIFTAIIVCGDYESQVIKNVYARGYSRESFYFAKLIYIVVTTSIMFFAAVAVSAILGAVLFGISESGGRIILLLATQYIAVVAGVTMYFAISAVIKKLGGSIAACIIAPMLVSLVFGLADTILKFNDFSIADIWLTSFTTVLSDIGVADKKIALCAALSVFYAAAFIWIGFAASKKSEV